MITYFRYALLACFSITLTLSNAFAAEITPEGAQRLKELLKAPIEAKQRIQKARNGAIMELDGEIIVEPEDTYYAVTMPPIKYIFPKGEYLNIGMISINAAPGKDDGTWKMSLALPTPLTVYDQNKAPLATIDIERQNASGIWDEQLANFKSFNGQYDNISARDKDGAFETQIKSVQITNNLVQDNNARWSGPGNLTAKDLRISTEKGIKLSFTEFKVNGDVKELDPKASEKWRNKLIELSEKSTEEETQEEISPINIFEDILNIFSDAKITYSLSGLQLNLPETDKNPAQDITLDNASLSAEISGLLSDLAKVGIDIDISKIKLSPEPAQTTGLFPDSFALHVLGKNLPKKDILQALKNDPQASANMALLLPSLLSKSGAQIKISEISSSRDNLYKTKIEGDINADTEAANRATANLKATISGFDPLIDKVQKKIKEGPALKAPILTQIAMTMQLIKGMGKAEVGENNTIDYTYALELNKAGKLYLNGQDMSLLMGSLMMGNKLIGSGAVTPNLNAPDATQKAQ